MISKYSVSFFLTIKFPVIALGVTMVLLALELVRMRLLVILLTTIVMLLTTDMTKPRTIISCPLVDISRSRQSIAMLLLWLVHGRSRNYLLLREVLLSRQGNLLYLLIGLVIQVNQTLTERLLLLLRLVSLLFLIIQLL